MNITKVNKVYIDGSCSCNGSFSAKAGIGIYFGPDDSRNVSKPININYFNNINKLTNNVAELYAIKEILQYLITLTEIDSIWEIITDSEYVIKCATTYGEKLYNKQWKSKKEIPNLELVKEVYELYNNHKIHKFIMLKHIHAHTSNTDTDSIGNREADKLATSSYLDN